MYNRSVLDDRTRVLIVIGECCVLDEQIQLPNHIRSALRMGATPREILEVILQSHIYAGMPRMIKAIRTYRALMKDLGLVELKEPAFRGDAREPERLP
jgi:alkylhydroperoxidase/carboxymuconolactone decarboxylase family protein YurZ